MHSKQHHQYSILIRLYSKYSDWLVLFR